MSPTPPGGRAASIRRRMPMYSVVSMALLMIISAACMIAVNSQWRQTERLNVAVTPASEGNRRIMQHMLEAQSTTRAFGMVAPRGGDAPILAQSRRGLAAEAATARAELAQLERSLSDAEVTDDSALRSHWLTLHSRQRVAAQGYLDFAMAYADRPPYGEYPLAEDQRLFGALSSANAGLQRGIDAERVTLHDHLTGGRARTVQAVVAATAIVGLLILVTARQIMVSLTTPLLTLRDTVRRQRLGDRDAWARTDVGAAEVRDLASDVNALTTAHLQLVDQQATSLALQRAGAAITRRTQDAPDLRNAILVFAVGLGRALRADSVLCATLDRQGEYAGGLVWESSGASTGYELPQRWQTAVLRYAAWMWRRERNLVIPDLREDPASFELPEGIPSPLDILAETEPGGGLLMVPIGIGDRAVGIIGVRTMRTPRVWTDVEIAFVNQSAAEVARVIVKSEVEADRVEYVRQLEELDRHKDDFLSTISHELRTPLTSIQGYLEMLEDGDAGPLDPRQLEMVGVIGRNSTRLMQLIEDLLVINRMDTSPAMSGSGQLVGVAGLVAQTVAELRPMADQGQVALEVRGDDTCEVMGDRVLLARALENVVSNGVKFTPAGGMVWLQVERVGEYVAVSCTDTGIGIPEAEQGQLFVRFARASNATAAQIQGTGLGLAIVKNIVERHGGRIDLASQVGLGTTVRLLLPSANYSALDGRADGRPGVPNAVA